MLTGIDSSSFIALFDVIYKSFCLYIDTNVIFFNKRAKVSLQIRDSTNPNVLEGNLKRGVRVSFSHAPFCCIRVLYGLVLLALLASSVRICCFEEPN